MYKCVIFYAVIVLLLLSSSNVSIPRKRPQLFPVHFFQVQRAQLSYPVIDVKLLLLQRHLIARDPTNHCSQ